MQSGNHCGGPVLDYDVCANDCAHCAHGHSLLQLEAGYGHGDDGGCGDSGGYCYDAGGYIVPPPCQPAPLHPPLHPSLHAGACDGASGHDPCRPALLGHWMFGCAASGCDAPTGGGYDDGGGDGWTEISLVQFSGDALLLLFGCLLPSSPVELKGPLGLVDSPVNLSSWGQKTSWFSAHPFRKNTTVF